MLVAELSVGWIDQRVGLGWVGNGSKFCFSGLGRVMGLKWQMFEKYNPSVDFSCVGHTITDTRSRLSAEKVESVELIRWGLRAGLI